MDAIKNGKATLPFSHSPSPGELLELRWGRLGDQPPRSATHGAIAMNNQEIDLYSSY
jgi:hypothetical protein